MTPAILALGISALAILASTTTVLTSAQLTRELRETQAIRAARRADQGPPKSSETPG